VDVPVVFMSIRWWRSVHPVVIEASGKTNLEPPMVLALVTAVVAFTLLYMLLVGARARLQEMETELTGLKRAWRERSDERE